MKLAFTSLVTQKIGPVTYGGVEGFTYNLIKELVKDGHRVDLYASADSDTPAKLHAVADSVTAKKTAMNVSIGDAYYLLVGQTLAREAAEYDLIHNNFFRPYWFGVFSPFITKPIVHTIHHAFYSDSEWKRVLDLFPVRENERFVFVSGYARKQAGSPTQSLVIYNGVDTDEYPFLGETTATASLLCIGRMIPEKGAAEAVQAVKDTDHTLILNAASVTRFNQEYFDHSIKPFLGERIQFLQKDNVPEKVALYQQAKALLFPIQWEEPFGLVMVEAMSTGTPVIAFARGAVPEIIEDGVTGFIVNPSDDDIRGDFMIKKTGVDGLKEAIEKLYTLTDAEYQNMRKQARKRIEEQFSLKKMVDAYTTLYTSLQTS